MEMDELKEILKNHSLWLSDKGGQRANLQKANLQWANLREANLQGAYLQGAYLQGAYLQGANLREANLQWAYLQKADLQGANLRESNIQNTILDCRKIRYLSDAIVLGTELFDLEWDVKELKNKYGLYQVPGENKALIAITQDLSGGFCFVHHRREIWLWSWTCPNPETVTVLWKME